MKFNEYDKDRLVRYVVAQFETLASELGTAGRAASVGKIYREHLVPRLEKWKEADPDLYKRLPTAGHVVVEGGERFALQHGETPLPPQLEGLFSDRSHMWGSHDKWVYVTEKMILENLPASAKESGQKSLALKDQGKRAGELLKEYLKKFTNPAQLSFSFPQLHTMFCKATGNTVKPQKRPRVWQAPSEELKTLVVTALVLSEAKNRS